MAKSLKGLKKLVSSLSSSDKAEVVKSMKNSNVVKMAGGGEATMKSGVVKLGMGGAPKSGVMKMKGGGGAKSGVKKLGRGGKLKK
tara:strand:- start:4888 stop:5142 length:255 start_codon:yes stop_codon:yes gene_type:complete